MIKKGAPVDETKNKPKRRTDRSCFLSPLQARLRGGVLSPRAKDPDRSCSRSLHKKFSSLARPVEGTVALLWLDNSTSSTVSAAAKPLPLVRAGGAETSSIT